MPYLRRIEDRHYIFTKGGLRRNDAATVTGDGSTAPEEIHSISQSGSTASTSTVYLGIGLGVGSAVLVGLIVVTILIIKKRMEHKRVIQGVKVEEGLQSAQRQHFHERPRPLSGIRCNTLLPVQGQAGWNALSSDETVNEPERVRREDKPKRSSVSQPKKFRGRGIPLKRLKRLTAILESPRSRNSPSLPVLDPMPGTAGVDVSAAHQPNDKAYNLRQPHEDDVFVCPGSPKLEVLPSFAIRSPGRYGARIAKNDNPRSSRSRSLDCMPFIPTGAISGYSSRMGRIPIHSRSFSLGAPPCRPPSGPVPPLPVIKPHTMEGRATARQGVCVSRMSSSSDGSTGSSGLIATPILVIPEENQPIGSPSFEDVVAQDDNASLKKVTTNQWQNPLVVGPRQVTSAPPKQSFERLKNHTSIRSNIARYSAESVVSRRMSSVSVVSSDSLRERFSLVQVGSADQISISRLPSENSLGSHRCVRKIRTPRKASRTSVSESGSPAERHKNGVLRDISGNSNMLSRQASNATQNSSRSSNGNPFQWDQPLPKPSALKGSPNARKGHRRQNCVRISTLTPQILGPPPSRPTSPSIMHGIEEEPDSEEVAQQGGVSFVSDQRPSRPSSTSFSNPTVRLRASLTPSSPTLSIWTAFQENGLPTQASDSQLSGSFGTRTVSRQSNCSSLHSIPYFPSPLKAAVSTTQLSHPIPEFYLSRPSTDIDEDENVSPLALTPILEPDLSSSPPVASSEYANYYPAHLAWPLTTITASNSEEYDPASPAWDESELESSSTFFPFAKNLMNESGDEEVSPRSRPVSYGADLPDTTPVSPKTMPEGFKLFFDKKDTGSKPARAIEKLTSANASVVMAQMLSNVDFPGAPILPPPQQDEAYAAIAPKPTAIVPRTVSKAAYLIPMRSPPQPPGPSKSSCVPSPLHINGKTNPVGPRSQPAQSVLKNAMVLRRMNSEANNIADRESRRFVRLGREASPLLPWIGGADPNESCDAMNELFDFDFAADTQSGAEEHNAWDLDEVYMAEVEKKLDGALAGFEAFTSDERSPENRSSSVWDDGEKYWEQKRTTPIGSAVSSPLTLHATPTKQVLGSPKSIQNTPRSLYDSNGFLRS